MPTPVIDFQPETYQQANPFLTGASNAQDMFAKALANAYAPQMTQAQIDQLNLANALSKIDLQTRPQMNQANLQYRQAQIPNLQAETENRNLINKYYPQAEQAEIAQRQAEAGKAQFFLQHPLLSLPGTAGQIGALDYVQQQEQARSQQQQPHQQSFSPVNSDNMSVSPQLSGAFQQASQMPSPQQGMQQGQSKSMAQMLQDSIIGNLEKNKSIADINSKRAQGYNYQSMPVDFKSQQLAMAAGLGIEPGEATQRFMNGESIQDMAQKLGVDVNSIDPIYPTTKGSLNQIQKRQQGLAEINTLNKTLTEYTAPYSQRFAGYSPKQIMQQISGEDPESQAKFLAAQALMPEMSALRVRTMAGNVGVEAIREITNASLGHIKTLQPFVKPEVYKRSQELIDQLLTQSVSAANKVGLQPGLANSLGQIQNIQNSGIQKSDPLGIR